MIFSNRELTKDDPGIEDLAPTTMSLLGLKPRKHMEGTPIVQ